MCAIQAGQKCRGRRTLVLDRAERPGKKILISGGGRCNFTNLHCAPENFLSANPHFAKSALARYTPPTSSPSSKSTTSPSTRKPSASSSATAPPTTSSTSSSANAPKPTPASSSPPAFSPSPKSLRSGIRGFCNASRRRNHPGPSSLSPPFPRRRHRRPLHPQDGRDRLRLRSRPSVRPHLEIVEPRPALGVPLVFTPEDARPTGATSPASPAGSHREYPGSPGNRSPLRHRRPLSSARSAAAPELLAKRLLITHRGLSGPAILQISSYWRPGESIELDLAPGRNITDPSSSSFLFIQLPDSAKPAATYAALSQRSSAPRHCSRAAPRRPLAAPPRPPAVLPQTQCGSSPTPPSPRLERQLHAWRITPAGTEGYAKAEVTTAGGVATAELDAKHHAEPQNPRPLLHRRSRRRHRMARWLQLPMGLGLRSSRRPIRLSAQGLPHHQRQPNTPRQPGTRPETVSWL